MKVPNGKVSNERLRRFIITKKEKPNNKSSQAKQSKIPVPVYDTKSDMSETDEESFDEAEIVDDSTETESIASSDENLPINVFSIPKKEILVEKYFAVLYDHNWYIGRVLSHIKEDTFLMKFLKQDVDLYKWPKEDDIAEVKNQFIFYGPLSLIGNGPVQLNSIDALKINKKYKSFKKNLMKT